MDETFFGSVAVFSSFKGKNIPATPFKVGHLIYRTTKSKVDSVNCACLILDLVFIFHRARKLELPVCTELITFLQSLYLRYYLTMQPLHLSRYLFTSKDRWTNHTRIEDSKYIFVDRYIRIYCWKYGSPGFTITEVRRLPRKRIFNLSWSH